MGQLMQTSEISVGKQGRIVIPASMRRQLAIEPGSHLFAWVEDGRLIMESKQQLWQSIHSACRDISQKTSLVDELINERRLAAKTEME